MAQKQRASSDLSAGQNVLLANAHGLPEATVNTRYAHAPNIAASWREYLCVNQYILPIVLFWRPIIWRLLCFYLVQSSPACQVRTALLSPICLTAWRLGQRDAVSSDTYDRMLPCWRRFKVRPSSSHRRSIVSRRSARRSSERASAQSIRRGGCSLGRRAGARPIQSRSLRHTLLYCAASWLPSWLSLPPPAAGGHRSRRLHAANRRTLRAR